MKPAERREPDDSSARPLRAAVRFITSVKLAVGLIAYLALASIASTLVPAWGTRFFASVAFLLPLAVFFVNLAACSIQRFVRELRRPNRRRHGPDLLHLGLMVLIVGALISYLAKSTGSVTLAPGQSANLPDGSTLTVTDFRYDRYPDGRPKDWASTLRLTANGVPVVDGYLVRVNRPLRRGRYTFYQSSYDTVWQLLLRDEAGTERVLYQGEQAILEGLPVYFMGVEDTADPASARALVRVGDGDDARVVHVATGDRLGATAIAEVRGVLAAGITAVADPGWPVVAAALALVAIGTAVTFLRKLREAS